MVAMVDGQHDAVIVGGGHNGLVAAAYLGRAGLRVLLLERLGHVGGAAVSEEPFPGVAARLSRYSYLVSLLPYGIVRELELDVELRSRPVASFTPVELDGKHDGLIVERKPGAETAESFRRITGSDADYRAWVDFYTTMDRLARSVAPTLLEPLLGKGDFEKLVREGAGHGVWRQVFAEPIGDALEAAFDDDTVRGVVLTDALIGTHSYAEDPSLKQNRCFLYHVIGGGTGEWRVPVGGMGAVTGALERAVGKTTAEVVTGAEVVSISADGANAEIVYRDDFGEHLVGARYVLAGVAPTTLDTLLGRTPGPSPEGSQLKINMVLDRLPRLRCGADPARAFAGTFHIDESYSALQRAYESADSGVLPPMLPAEVYCHTLTDPTILGSDLIGLGAHTLTLFGLHAPARLFEADPSLKEEAVRRCIAGINRYLVDPLDDCLTRDLAGNPCIEARTPPELEAELGLPRGHIFHNDLTWPYAESGDEVGTWGVETDVANVFLCGSGARRGGGVSGVPGHNAACAVFDREQQRRR